MGEGALGCPLLRCKGLWFPAGPPLRVSHVGIAYRAPLASYFLPLIVLTRANLPLATCICCQLSFTAHLLLFTPHALLLTTYCYYMLHATYVLRIACHLLLTLYCVQVRRLAGVVLAVVRGIEEDCFVDKCFGPLPVSTPLCPAEAVWLEQAIGIGSDMIEMEGGGEGGMGEDVGGGQDRA